MQENRKKPVILGEKSTVLLWGFKITAKDKRDGSVVDGYIVVTGNEDYDIDEAQEEIRKKYAALGYLVTECVYDDSRTYIFDALEEYRNAEKPTKCKSCSYYINLDDSVGQAAGCELTADNELMEEDIETYEKVIAAENAGGEGCPCLELLSPEKKEPEDKPDFLAEIMATLEELEEGAQ